MFRELFIKPLLLNKYLTSFGKKRIKTVIDIKKEAFYINHVFPKIVKTKDSSVREDFLENSGLDRFYVETLERNYLRNKGMPYSAVEEIFAESVTDTA